MLVVLFFAFLSSTSAMADVQAANSSYPTSDERARMLLDALSQVPVMRWIVAASGSQPVSSPRVSTSSSSDDKNHLGVNLDVMGVNASAASPDFLKALLQSVTGWDEPDDLISVNGTASYLADKDDLKVALIVSRAILGRAAARIASETAATELSARTGQKADLRLDISDHEPLPEKRSLLATLAQLTNSPTIQTTYEGDAQWQEDVSHPLYFVFAMCSLVVFVLVLWTHRFVCNQQRMQEHTRQMYMSGLVMLLMAPLLILMGLSSDVPQTGLSPSVQASAQQNVCVKLGVFSGVLGTVMSFVSFSVSKMAAAETRRRYQHPPQDEPEAKKEPVRMSSLPIRCDRYGSSCGTCTAVGCAWDVRGSCTELTRADMVLDTDTFVTDLVFCPGVAKLEDLEEPKDCLKVKETVFLDGVNVNLRVDAGPPYDTTCRNKRMYDGMVPHDQTMYNCNYDDSSDVVEKCIDESGVCSVPRNANYGAFHALFTALRKLQIWDFGACTGNVFEFSTMNLQCCNHFYLESLREIPDPRVLGGQCADTDPNVLKDNNDFADAVSDTDRDTCEKWVGIFCIRADYFDDPDRLEQMKALATHCPRSCGLCTIPDLFLELPPYSWQSQWETESWGRFLNEVRQEKPLSETFIYALWARLQAITDGSATVYRILYNGIDNYAKSTMQSAYRLCHDNYERAKFISPRATALMLHLEDDDAFLFLSDDGIRIRHMLRQLFITGKKSSNDFLLFPIRDFIQNEDNDQTDAPPFTGDTMLLEFSRQGDNIDWVLHDHWCSSRKYRLAYFAAARLEAVLEGNVRRDKIQTTRRRAQMTDLVESLVKMSTSLPDMSFSLVRNFYFISKEHVKILGEDPLALTWRAMCLLQTSIREVPNEPECQKSLVPLTSAMGTANLYRYRAPFVVDPAEVFDILRTRMLFINMGLSRHAANREAVREVRAMLEDLEEQLYYRDYTTMAKYIRQYGVVDQLDTMKSVDQQNRGNSEIERTNSATTSATTSVIDGRGSTSSMYEDDERDAYSREDEANPTDHAKLKRNGETGRMWILLDDLIRLLSRRWDQWAMYKYMTKEEFVKDFMISQKFKYVMQQQAEENANGRIDHIRIYGGTECRECGDHGVKDLKVVISRRIGSDMYWSDQ